MILAFIVSFISGVFGAMLWERIRPKKLEEKTSARDDGFIPVGPFAIKKKSNKRRPVSHDDKSDWEREMRDSGKLI